MPCGHTNENPKEIVMSLINKEVSEFSVQAFQDNAFKTVTKADILGKCPCFSSIRRTLRSCAPRSLRISLKNMKIARPSKET